MVIPKTRYAKSGDVHVAYQVIGEGERDLVFVSGWVSHVEMQWEDPSMARFLRRLASFTRLICFDKRGTGLSDRVSEDRLPTLEQRMDDVRAVMEAAGSERAAVFGISEGGPMAALFAATYPERCSALVMYGTYAKRIWAPDYPWAPTPEERQVFYDLIEHEWANGMDLSTIAPSTVGDRAFQSWLTRYFRAGASPSAALALARMNTQADITHVLPAISAPTLVIHRTGDLDVDVGGARYMAERIPGARLVELPGNDHLPWVGDTDALLDEVEELLTGARHHREASRVLATVMFTDIAGSTERAASLGDRAWKDLLERHHSAVRRVITSFRGIEIDTAGDGFLATFDGPARAVRCAQAIHDAVRDLGLELRAGLHTGEVELAGNGVRGLAVHVGARIASLAAPGETLVSSTVKDLVAGSGIEFADRGPHALKGVPDEWRIYAVTSS